MQPDQDFSRLDERLFLRVPPGLIDPKAADIGIVSRRAIRFPVFSVNREKYSQRPNDVIRGYDGWSVISLSVGDLKRTYPVQPPKGAELVYEFKPVHDPNPPEDPDNDSHTNVCAFRDDIPIDGKVAKTAKTAFIDHLATRIVPLSEQDANLPIKW